MDLILRLIALMSQTWNVMSGILIDSVPVTALIFSIVAISFVLSLVKGKV